MRHQFCIVRPHRTDLIFDALAQGLFGLTPGQPPFQGSPEIRSLLGRGKGLVQRVEMGAFGILGLSRQARIRDDARDGILQRLGPALEQRNGIVVALGHLAPIQPRQSRHRLVDLDLRQDEQVGALAIQMIEALGDVACHLQMLDLVAPHRHPVGIEHQDVGRHQHRIGKQPHGDAIIGLDTLGGIGIDRRFVSMRTIHQAFGRDAVQHPAQFRDFRHIRLAIERHPSGIQTGRNPGGGDLQPGAGDAGRIVALDQGVVIRQEEEGVHTRLGAGLDRGPDGTGVIAQMGSARRGDAGQDTGDGCAHGISGGWPDIGRALQDDRGPTRFGEVFARLHFHQARHGAKEFVRHRALSI